MLLIYFVNSKILLLNKSNKKSINRGDSINKSLYPQNL